jgi:mannose-6-phosphate isomerase-like protein (cupin superfamily)
VTVRDVWAATPRDETLWPIEQTTNTADYTIKRLDEMDSAFGGGFKRVRASLGAEAFGMQVIDLPPNSGEIYPEHDHLHDGQEEIYVVLEGDGEMELPDRTVPIDRDTYIRVGPSTRRRVRGGPNGIRVLVVGGVRGRPYTPQPNSLLGGPEVLAPTARSSLLGRGRR